jgi:MFS family permease
MRLRRDGLWGHTDFLKLWAGQTISVFGSYVSGFALSLVAVLTLDATPPQIALLAAAGYAPALVVAPFAGVWLDRVQRRPVLIATDLARALLLASVPLAYALDRLRYEQLVVVAVLLSALTVGFDIAYRAYLPSLVRPDQLVEGNAKLQGSNSVAEVAGFGLAGLLVQALTAPLAILVDVASFIVSALSLRWITTVEPVPRSAADSSDGSEAATGAWQEMREGLRLVTREPGLRALLMTSGTWEFSRAMVGAVIILFVARELDVPPALMGILFGIGGLSALGGAMVSGAVTRRWGNRRTMASSLMVAGGSILFLPLAGGPLPFVLLFLAAQQLVGDGAATIFEVNRTSLLQAATPGRLQGRLHASARVVEWGAVLLGLLLGGVLGGLIGVRLTLVVSGLGCMLAPLWLRADGGLRVETNDGAGN